MASLFTCGKEIVLDGMRKKLKLAPMFHNLRLLSRTIETSMLERLAGRRAWYRAPVRGWCRCRTGVLKAKASREASKESVAKWSELVTDEQEIKVSTNQMQVQFQMIMLDYNQDLLRCIEQRWMILTFSSSSAMIFHQQHVLVM